MMLVLRPILGSIAGMTLAGCGAPQSVAPSTNVVQSKAVTQAEQAVAPQQAQPALAQDASAQKEAMVPLPGRVRDTGSKSPEPEPVTTPPTPPTPLPSLKSPPAGRVIRPAPTQPPAEVDPPHRYPGDEVPR